MKPSRARIQPLADLKAEDVDILTAKEVASLLKCSRAQVYRLRLDGSIPPRYKLFKGEKGWRWTRCDIEKYLSGCVVDRHIRDETPKFIPVQMMR